MSLKERLVFEDGTAAVAALQDSDWRAARQQIERHLHARVIEDLGMEADTDDALLRQRLERRLNDLIAEETLPMSSEDRNEIITNVIDNVVGYGPIQTLLDDPSVTEVMVNNAHDVYVERGGKIYKTDREFIDEAHLLRVIDKMVTRVGRRIDEAAPMVDARLADGSRVNAIIAPLAIKGPVLTVRKFSVEPLSVHDLIAYGTIDERFAAFAEACVRGRLNILISGGTGSGKTTLLNVMSGYIPDDERIVTIEDAAELRLNQNHVIPLESRPPNIEGTGSVAIRDLVRNSLRMRPDRIIVGEVRGGEALDMLQAMNTGHDGSMSTIHSNSTRDALSRLETMVLMAGFDLPVRAIREQQAAALNVIIHLARLKDGTRRVEKVCEVQAMEGDVIVLQDIFVFDYSMGLDSDGRFRGRLKASGVRPTFARHLEFQGIDLPSELFEYEPPERR